MEQFTPSEAERWLECYNAALEAGLSEQESAIFATGGGDVDELAKLVDGGCSTELIARIVL